MTQKARPEARVLLVWVLVVWEGGERTAPAGGDGRAITSPSSSSNPRVALGHILYRRHRDVLFGIDKIQGWVQNPLKSVVKDL